jgi:chromosomal replication initiation ATPase DnaA
VSEQRADPVDLAYIGRALHRLTTDVAAMRDEMRVQTAMILRQDASIGRQDATLNAVLEQLRAMVAQHQRTAERVRALEDKIDEAPSR